jgi:tellurite resistance protein TerC
LWSTGWVLISFLFLAWLWWYLGGASADPTAKALASDKSLEFVTGYLIEKALAVDNIFVFLMIFTYFGVPQEFQKRVLMIGILGALVLRAIMIGIGAWAITRFNWLLYVFGAFLIFTGIRMWLAAGQEPDLESNPALKWIRKHTKVAPHYDDEKLTTIYEGARAATPLAVVIVLIGIVDVIFAVDSIPAIFAITTDTFIVLSSNVFAILGLRAMYFLLAGMQERFHLLSYGLALILVVIGTKMLLIDVYKVPVLWSLAVTGTILLVTILLSLAVPPMKGAHRGAYPFAKKKPQERSPS